MTQEEIFELQAELQRLQKENTRLKALSVVPSSHTTERIPSDLKVDPLFDKLRDQLTHLSDANLIFVKVMELSQQAEKDLSALIPALEVQFHGMNNEIAQLKTANIDMENAYVSVVEKLEAQVRELKEQLKAGDQQLSARLSAMEQRQAEMEAHLTQSQALNARYQEKLEALQEEKNAAPEKANPFTSLNIFEL